MCQNGHCLNKALIFKMTLILRFFLWVNEFTYCPHVLPPKMQLHFQGVNHARILHFIVHSIVECGGREASTIKWGSGGCDMQAKGLGDVNRRNITIKKTGLKWGHTKHMHINNAHWTALWGKLSDPFWAIGWVSVRNACTQLNAAQVTNRRNQKSVCTYGAMTSLVSRRSGRIAHTNGELCGCIQAL